MKKITLVLFFFTVTLLQAGGWKTLKPLSAYSASDLHLKENVAYLEIRRYRTKKSTKAYEVMALYRTPLDQNPQGVVDKFKRLTPKYSNRTDFIPYYGNAFLIDSAGKMFRMDMAKDVISLLGAIDRPAEAQLVLWLRNYGEGQYYRKIARGYETKRTFVAKGCVTGTEIVTIDGSSAFPPSNFRYSKKGCRQRKHTQFITSRKLNYERYDAIAMDAKENLYLLGTVKESKSPDDYTYDVVLDKYTRDGKKLWSRNVKGLEGSIATSIVADRRSVTILGSGKPLAIYSLNGKRQSLQKSDRSKFGKKKEMAKEEKYLPEGLPDPKNGIDAEINDRVKDKKGSTYIAGSELFYPSGSPAEVPVGECGNVETISGALVVKLDKNGKTVWARVIDGDE